MMDFRALEALDRQDYLSPLVAATPDLRRHFKHIWGRRQPSSFGHIVYSDWADSNAADDPTGYYRETGFWTRDEAAILYHCARQRRDSFWLDIGALTGWTAAHAAAAGATVIALDPLLKYDSFLARFEDNTQQWSSSFYELYDLKSNEFFCKRETPSGFDGIVIDGEHGWHEPLIDAQHAAQHANKRGVILFHDFIGGPVREGVGFLISQGWKCRVYFTPHMVACCWRGKFTPPEHVPDPAIASMLRERCPDFGFERCV